MSPLQFQKQPRGGTSAHHLKLSEAALEILQLHARIVAAVAATVPDRLQRGSIWSGPSMARVPSVLRAIVECCSFWGPQSAQSHM